MLGVDTPLILALLLCAAFSWLALSVPGLVADRRDALIRAARTAIQTGLGLLLAALSSGELELSVVLNVVTPAIVTAATVIHSAIQPAERVVEDV